MSSSVKIAIFIGTLFLAVGVYLPFFPLWLEKNNYNKSEIALILSLPLIMKVILTPFVTASVTRFPTRRHAALLYCFVSFAAFVSIAIFDGLIAILFFMTIYGTFFAALLPLGDSFALTEVRLNGANFGRIRLWGSITFIVSNLLAGFLIQLDRGVDEFFLISFMLLLGFFAAFLLPVYHEPASLRKRENPSLLGALWSCFRKPVFLSIIVCSALLQASHALVYGFGTIDWVDRGYSTNEIGAFWAIGVIAEILLFTQAKFLFNRMKPHILLLIGGLAAIVRWMLHPEIEGITFILMLQVLHGLTFGATYLGMQSYIAAAFSEEETPSAQGAMVFVSGLTMAILTYASGFLFQSYGSGAYYFMALISFVALFPLLIFLTPKRR